MPRLAWKWRHATELDWAASMPSLATRTWHTHSPKSSFYGPKSQGKSKLRLTRSSKPVTKANLWGKRSTRMPTNSRVSFSPKSSTLESTVVSLKIVMKVVSFQYILIRFVSASIRCWNDDMETIPGMISCQPQPWAKCLQKAIEFYKEDLNRFSTVSCRKLLSSCVNGLESNESAWK